MRARPVLLANLGALSRGRTGWSPRRRSGETRIWRRLRRTLTGARRCASERRPPLASCKRRRLGSHFLVILGSWRLPHNHPEEAFLAEQDTSPPTLKQRFLNGVFEEFDVQAEDDGGRVDLPWLMTATDIQIHVELPGGGRKRDVIGRHCLSRGTQGAPAKRRGFSCQRMGSILTCDGLGAWFSGRQRYRHENWALFSLGCGRRARFCGRCGEAGLAWSGPRRDCACRRQAWCGEAQCRSASDCDGGALGGAMARS